MFSSVNAEENIGQVNKVKTWAYGTRVEQKRESLFDRDDAYQNQVIETVKGGAIWIIFNDDTELFMGESGSLTLDEFVYEPFHNSLILNLTKGVFRFISGSMESENVQIKTPVSTIGIRGTDVEITIDDTGATTITAFEGTVTIIAEQIGFMTDGCQTVIVASDGSLLWYGPCPPGGPSIGPASFASSSGHDGGGPGNQSSSSGDSGGPSGGDSGGPSGGDSGGPGDGPGDGPSGGPGNGNGNNGNSGNGGGNTNGSGPGTGNNGSNNGQGHGAGNGGGGNGNGGNR